MPVDPDTAAAYQAGARAYADRGTAPSVERAAPLVAAAVAGHPVLDLGCGTGYDLGVLGPDVVGVDPVAAMVAEARTAHRATPLVRAAAGALPFRPRSFGAAWASKSLQHVAGDDLPLALADLHRSLAVDAPVAVRVFGGSGSAVADDDLPGRRFTFWTAAELADLAVGAGFVDVRTEDERDVPADLWPKLDLTATRARTLPDTVGPGMRLLVSGLNPSLNAADAGVGYAGPGNRFWPALAAADLLPRGADRDPWRLLADGRIGMTDIVKRATPRAAELTTAEFRAGVERLDRLGHRLRPAAVVLVGLAGWRAAVDRRAGAGWQPRPLGASPVYVMPSTSGLNAGTSLTTLVDHLRTAAAGP